MIEINLLQDCLLNASHVCCSKCQLSVYEKHVLLGLSQIYYWLYKCTTCHHYTNIIKMVWLKLIKTINLFTKCGSD